MSLIRQHCHHCSPWACQAVLVSLFPSQPPGRGGSARAGWSQWPVSWWDPMWWPLRGKPPPTPHTSTVPGCPESQSPRYSVNTDPRPAPFALDFASALFSQSLGPTEPRQPPAPALRASGTTCLPETLAYCWRRQPRPWESPAETAILETPAYCWQLPRPPAQVATPTMWPPVQGRGGSTLAGWGAHHFPCRSAFPCSIAVSV